jgi:hypothetical protein
MPFWQDMMTVLSLVHATSDMAVGAPAAAYKSTASKVAQVRNTQIQNVRILASRGAFNLGHDEPHAAYRHSNNRQGRQYSSLMFCRKLV